jgi:hypothetical protein
MDKTNFLLYKDFKPNIDILTDEQAGKLFKAVFAYVNGRVEPNFEEDGMLIATFTMLKTTLERDLKKYKLIVERNRKNGSNGGRPPNKDKETQSVNDKPKKPSGLTGNPKNPNEPKKADSDSDSGIDSVSDIDNDKKDKTITFADFDKMESSYIFNKKEIKTFQLYEDESLNELFNDYLMLRISIKATNSKRAIKTLYNKLDEITDLQKEEVLNEAIVGSWKSVYTDKYIDKPTQNKKEPTAGGADWMGI